MERLPVSGLEVFLAVAEHGSLRKAAGALGVQPPAVSYRLKSLEDQLGTTLFVRTTRSIRLTDAGKALLARSRPAMAELGEALDDARASGGARKGALRITLPYAAYELTVARKLAAFLLQYPEIEIELSFNEAFVDLVEEGFHAGVRLGDHIQEDMVAVRLFPPLREVVFAAPAYFERHGRPGKPRDLLGHNCVRYRYIASRRFAPWQFQDTEGLTTIDVKGTLIVNSTTALIHAVRSGIGVGWLFRPSIEADLASGALESVLDSYSLERPGYFLYFPRAYARIEVLRLFTDFMRQG